MKVPRRQRARVLRPLHPNVGVEMEYRRKLEKLINVMHKSIMWWVRVSFKQNEPEMAIDARPASVLRIVMNRLASRWLKKFDKAAIDLAKYFTDDVKARTDARMKRLLKDAGISVPFKMTAAQKDIAQATINANVSLIKSIPKQYLLQVEGIVMRSVQHGGDLHQLSNDLQKQFGVTKRRAEFIAHDQNNKATSAFTAARQRELGITEAVWMHSHAGKEPRPTHVKMDGKKYDVTKGMFDTAEKRFIFPGELINCRCISRSVIPGFS